MQTTNIETRRYHEDTCSITLVFNHIAFLYNIMTATISSNNGKIVCQNVARAMLVCSYQQLLLPFLLTATQ